MGILPAFSADGMVRSRTPFLLFAGFFVKDPLPPFAIERFRNASRCNSNTAIPHVARVARDKYNYLVLGRQPQE